MRFVSLNGEASRVEPLKKKYEKTFILNKIYNNIDKCDTSGAWWHNG